MAGGGSGSSSQSSYGTSSGQSHSEIVVPEALQPLYKQSANNLMQLQNMMPLWGSTSTTPKQGANPITTSVLTQPAPQSYSAPLGGGNLYVDSSGKVTRLDPGTIGNDLYYGRGNPWSRDTSGNWVNGTETYAPYGTPGAASYYPIGGPENQFFPEAGKEPVEVAPGVYQDQNLPFGQRSRVYTNQPIGGTGKTNWQQTGGQPQAQPAYGVPAGVNTQGLIPVTNPDGSTSYYNPSDVSTSENSPNFLSSNPMQVAGLDPNQRLAALLSREVGATPQNEITAQQYGLLAPLLAGRMATGAGASTDPALLAAEAAFEKTLAPGIENQMGLSGLGKSSSLANSLAMAKAQYELPLIQDYINREQGVLTNQANMYASLMPQFASLGSTDTARLLQGINALSQTGATGRAASQDVFTSNYQDFLRRQALAEQALFVPFGATATASIGPKSDSSYTGSQISSGSGSQSSGMFK